MELFLAKSIIRGNAINGKKINYMSFLKQMENKDCNDAIRRVLDDYVKIYHISYLGKETRCNLRSLSSDYERIRNIAESMTAQGIRLP